MTTSGSDALRPSTSTFALSGSPATDPVVGEIEQFLQDAMAQMVPDPRQPRGRGRPRVLPALALWAGLLVCVLQGFGSWLALWRSLSLHQLWSYPRFPVSDQAVYKRLAAAGTAPLEGLFAQITAVLRERLAPFAATDLAPFAAEVVALDETTLDQVARILPALRGAPPGDDRLLPGKLAGLFDLRRQLWRRLEHHPAPHQNEKTAARQMLAGLPLGSLILADLGYFAFAWFDALTDLGYWWVSRLRAKTSYQVRHVFYQSKDVWDGIIWLGAHRADRAAHPVRLVRFTVGPVTWAYVTNVLDPTRLSLHEIALLYARRWDIELAFLLIKRELGLHFIWSPKPQLILHQVYAVLCIAQIVQALRLELAVRAGIDPFEVSLPLFLRYLPILIAKGEADPLAVLVARGEAAGILRPSRRTRITTPPVDLTTLVPAPPEALQSRIPRYAHRKCAPRTN